RGVSRAAGGVTGRAPPFLGHDGAITLLAALAVAGLTLGIAPLLAMRAVARTAREAPLTPPAAPARILVLGHRLADGAVSAVFAARLDRALALARAMPRARVLLLGGQTSPGALSEAEAGRDWLVARGLDPARIGLETRSRHTLENLANHRAGGGGGANEALVTSRAHLHRALLMARGLGLAPTPVAAEDAIAANPIALAAEGFMVHWYVTGRWLSRLLRRRAWLERIGA
uniref:YdcF family protein n=1 Tax=Roseomonas rosulenta TaxID=2748667 RepID=UPI001E33A6AF